MFAPDIIHYEAPDSCVRFMEALCEDKEAESKLFKCIKEHHFNSKMILHLPNTLIMPQALLNSLSEDTCYYHVRNLNVSELCKYEFIKAFVDCGNVFGYSLNTRLDVDNCAAFTPSGSLFLSVDNFIYHSLGISGKLSSHILRHPKNRFVVEVDTHQQGFLPNKNLYQRIHNAFTACPLYFDFCILWKPRNDKVCPSSIAKYFHTIGYQVEERTSIIREDVKSDVKIPLMKELIDQDPDYLDDILEWVGFEALEIIQNRYKETIVSNIHVPEPFVFGILRVEHIDGFYSPTHIEDIVKILREIVTENTDSDVPWVSLTVYGPPDCLISWCKSENTFRVNGDNLYTLIIQRDKTALFTISGSRKPMRLYAKSSNK